MEGATSLDFKQLIGEATAYDKKEKLEEKEPRSWLKSVSAFANGFGGMLIFGIVDKTGEIVGVDYPERAVEEGIVNALIHRDYLVVGSEVHIDIFEYRLEIYSPGGMVDGINVQDRDIMQIPSQRRNPIIADMFSRLHFMERRGSGIKKIIKEYEAQYKYSDDMHPEFISENGGFFLTLKNLNYRLSQKGDKKGDKKAMKKSDEIAERTELVFAAISEKPDITVKELVSQLGITQKQTENALKKLKESNRIHREGNTRSGKWVIN